MREVVSGFERQESALIKEATGIYLRNVYDYTIQMLDAIETFRDTPSGMLDIYLSSISNRMNEVMKVLTTIATIFIPLTFIAGIYGMNFKFMPELGLRWGYFAVLSVILMMTGLDEKRARFQAISAFSGTGFTTKEPESGIPGGKEDLTLSL